MSARKCAALSPASASSQGNDAPLPRAPLASLPRAAAALRAPGPLCAGGLCSPRDGQGGGNRKAGRGEPASYGLLYKVAVPPVVSVSPLPPAFSVASPLLPHPGLPYSPVHYAQLPPAPLHFVGSPYSLPYALPPGFLPGPLLPASRLPHFVPYAPLLLEEAGPPAHGFGKAPAGPLSLQPHGGGGGTQPLDVGQSRFPVQYQLSHLPAGYSAFEVPLADQSSELPLQDSKLITANGVGRPAAAAAAAGTKLSEVLDMGSGSAEGQLPRTTAESPADSHFFTSCQSLRTEVSMASQRSTPETDLEVQRVVGVFASQDYPACSGQQMEGLSPLNLSHRDLLEQGEEPGRNPGQAAAEKSHPPRLSAKSPVELLYRNQILHGLTMANGKAVSGSLPLAAQDGLGRGSPEVPALDRAPSRGGHLPSHFVKGAIIQLATGELKRVEDLQTQDFVRSAEVSGGLKIDSSTVVDIQESPWQGFVTLHFVVGEQQSKVSIDVPPEHPFFVYGQGWSSCSPERTARLFALPCHRLQVGDVCISISLQSLNGRPAPQASQGAPRERLGRASQGFREPQARAEGEGPVQKGAVSLGPSPESPRLEPTSQHGWAGPGFQKVGEEPRSPLVRPSFIPQEVKLSIEGRSNAGK
ncbi:PREDICTED: ataxin-1-like [Gekko japonicus]|uniref:Ataxin-1-like n=1 Tax=Gekko japonicus TaxID=146911 RepID=A0ABM1LCK6_GEKJA|nr:PREDICTED: ataxin-1-like [Gekko japonicus]